MKIGKGIIHALAIIVIILAILYALLPLFTCSMQYGEVNIGDSLIVITTILSAYWVSNILSKNLHQQKSQKEILMKVVDEVRDYLDELAKEVNKNETPFFNISPVPKRIRTKVNMVYELMTECKYTVDSKLKGISKNTFFLLA